MTEEELFDIFLTSDEAKYNSSSLVKHELYFDQKSNEFYIVSNYVRSVPILVEYISEYKLYECRYNTLPYKAIKITLFDNWKKLTQL